MALAVLNLLGGLALFLYGMRMMSDGLESAAGNKMKSVLEKLTSNRFLGIGVGAVITAVVQSSSATTVMAVGFVNSGMMTLKQAVWIIMGSNIGTTITGQLIALNVKMIAPLLAFFGVAMIVFLKTPKVNHIGKILAGFGILFLGMNMMSSSMTPFRESEAFISLMTRFENPILAILAGAVFTAVIQSSSAAVGILQTLAISGILPFSSAVYILFGTNIGTCITAVLSAIGTNRSAKRTTIIHLLFNVIGTVIFTLLCVSLPVSDWVAMLSPESPASQIANMHTIFNVLTTIILLPFGSHLAKMAEKLLPEPKRATTDEPLTLRALTEEFRRGITNLGSSAVHTDLLRQEIKRMVTMATDNTYKGFEAVLNSDLDRMKQVEETEETLDILNKDISQYISKILVHNNSGQSVADIEEYFLITGNAERIGDHAMNIGGYVELIKARSIEFSEGARNEIREMQTIVNDALQAILMNEADITDVTEWLSDIAAKEQAIDDMTIEYRDKHLERMRRGKCSEEACVLYAELLTDFERIGDHFLNIAQAYAKIYAQI